MPNGKYKKSRGYTIVEVLIVLAISAVMFLIAAQFVNGKQERASFNVGVNDMASNLQQVIDQVSSGQYSDQNLSCQDSGGSTLTFPPGSNAQGTNSQCVFMGKLIHFQANNSPNYEIFTLAGARQATTGDATMGGLKPTVVDNSNVNLTTQEAVPQNLDVVSVTINGVLNRSYTLGFLGSTGNDNRAIPVYASATTTPNEPSAQAVNDINTTSADSRLATDLAASICVTDGTRYATINIGDFSTNANQLSVDVKNYGTTTCPAASATPPSGNAADAGSDSGDMGFGACVSTNPGDLCYQPPDQSTAPWTGCGYGFTDPSSC